MRILMIALPYHGYAEKIAAEFRAAGHDVSLHEVQPRDFLTKALRVTMPGLWQARMNLHHRHILQAEAGQHYDMLLFIQCHQVSARNMAAFRAQFPSAQFTLYNWDSIANHDYRPHLPAFDHVLTFDPEDARRYKLEYLPLFCSREFQALPRRDQQRRMVYFVGNVVSQARYEAIDRFRHYCETQGIALETHLACTPTVQARLRKAGIKPQGLKNGPIEQPKFLDMIERSVAVFDFANHVQTGYTMRIFENLCAGKKIITSNARIRHEDFYSPDRIHIFDGTDFGDVKSFLQVPLAQPDATFPEFHIQSFADALLRGRGHPLPGA